MSRPSLPLFAVALTGVLILASAPVALADRDAKDPKAAAAACVQTARGPLNPAAEAASPPAPGVAASAPLRARVGKPAPDFEANALVGATFKNLKLSDYQGKWVVLCFYPGDFTFV